MPGHFRRQKPVVYPVAAQVVVNNVLEARKTFISILVVVKVGSKREQGSIGYTMVFVTIEDNITFFLSVERIGTSIKER